MRLTGKRAMPSLIAVTAFASLTLAACSSSSSSSTAAAGSSSSAPAAAQSTSSSSSSSSCQNGQGVTATTITLGTDTPLSGALAALGQANYNVQKAVVAQVNASGGINGRQLKLISQDDKYTPQISVTNAQYLINQAKVFGIWGDVGSVTGDAVLPLTVKNHVPFIFPYDLDTDITQPVKPGVFAVATPAFDQAKATSDYMATHAPFKGLKIGILAQNNADGAQWVSGFKAGQDGSKLLPTQYITNNETTFNAQLLALHQAGARVIYSTVGDTAFAAILTEANSLGIASNTYELGTVGVVTANVAKLAGSEANGAYAAVPNAFSPTGSGAGITALRNALTKYVPSAPPATTINSLSVSAWIGGQLMVKAMKDAGSCLNINTFNAAMEKITNFSTGGLSSPVSFSATNHLGLHAVGFVKLENGTWTQVSPFSG